MCRVKTDSAPAIDEPRAAIRRAPRRLHAGMYPEEALRGTGFLPLDRKRRELFALGMREPDLRVAEAQADFLQPRFH